MAAKDGRGGARPGAGRKPIPVEDIARIKRMREAGISKYSIAKTLHYDQMTIAKYAKRFEANDADE